MENVDGRIVDKIKEIIPIVLKPDSGEWKYTTFAIHDARKNGLYEEPSVDSPKGKYLGRDIIARDTKINGGVYVGGSLEAIVVDDSYEESQLKAIYKPLAEKRNKIKQDGGDYKEGVLEEVMEIAYEKLPYSLGGVDRVNEQQGVKQGDKVSLDVYLDSKVGVCRHQALLVGYLLEKLVNEGLLNGKVSVDRNYVRGKGGHAWVRYESSSGETFILDPANHFVGNIKDIDPKDLWFYKRPMLERILKIIKK